MRGGTSCESPPWSTPSNSEFFFFFLKLFCFYASMVPRPSDSFLPNWMLLFNLFWPELSFSIRVPCFRVPQARSFTICFLLYLHLLSDLVKLFSFKYHIFSKSHAFTSALISACYTPESFIQLCYWIICFTLVSVLFPYPFLSLLSFVHISNFLSFHLCFFILWIYV